MARYLYALLAGINEYPNKKDRLNGCVDDIERWHDCLAAQAAIDGYVFQPLVLKDEAATRQAIIGGLARHLSQAQEDDVAVFCFAGHGSYISGQKAFNQTPDEINQTLVCWDSRTDGSRDLVDKELSNLVAKVAEGNPQIVLILDCCHSGSASRDRDIVERQLEPQWLEASQQDFYSSGATSDSTQQGAETEVSRSVDGGTGFVQREGRHVLLAACHETETAKEIRVDGVSRGAFSVSLQKILVEASYRITYAELMTRAGGAIKQLSVKDQEPQLEIIKGGEKDHELLFLTQKQQGSRDDIFMLSYQDGWVVNGGRAHGWTQRGVELSVFSSSATPKDIEEGLEKLGVVVVEEIHPGFSRVAVTAGLALDKDKSYKAVVSKRMALSELTVLIKGEAAGVEVLRCSLEEMDPSLVSAKAVTDVEQAMVVLEAAEKEYLIFRGNGLSEPMSVPVASRPYGPPLLANLIEPLGRVARWLRLYNLSASAGDGEVEFRLSQNQVLQEGMDFRLGCNSKNNRWVVPGVQFQVANKTSARIYCAVLYLSPEFGISAGLMPAGGLWVEPGEVGKSVTFDVAIPEAFIERGVAEYPTFFKLIASGEKFDARLWQQEGLEKVGREIIVVQPEVWMTKEITIQCVVPEKDEDRSPVVTERPISGGTEVSERSPVVTERPLQSDKRPIPVEEENSSVEKGLSNPHRHKLSKENPETMSESKSFTQSNTGGVNFQNQVSGGQVNQGQNITINNDQSMASTDRAGQSSSEEATTILFLAANPNGTTKLRLDKELREIDESLRRAQKRDQFNLESKGAVRKQDFYRAVLDTGPKIIHFSGHGTGEEGLALENNQGNVVLLSTETVEGLFELVAEEGVECVLLNACYSDVQAKAIQKHIPYVIGMNQSITDEAAIQFATAFYDAIAAGKAFEYAFKLGRVQLLEFGKDAIPQLLKQSA